MPYMWRTMMTEVKKAFDQELFEENDPKARKAVMGMLAGVGIETYENPNKYGVDLVVGRYEIERRECWTGDKFPFQTVHIPRRKRKFFNTPIIYCIVNKEYTHMMYIDSGKIMMCPVREVKNKYVAEGEFFYDVDLELFSTRRLP